MLKGKAPIKSEKNLIFFTDLLPKKPHLFHFVLHNSACSGKDPAARSQNNVAGRPETPLAASESEDLHL